MGRFLLDFQLQFRDVFVLFLSLQSTIVEVVVIIVVVVIAASVAIVVVAVVIIVVRLMSSKSGSCQLLVIAALEVTAISDGEGILLFPTVVVIVVVVAVSVSSLSLVFLITSYILIKKKLETNNIIRYDRWGLIGVRLNSLPPVDSYWRLKNSMSLRFMLK